MSIETSVEIAPSPEIAAGVFDRELLDIANHLSEEVKRGTQAELVYRQEGVEGCLCAAYLGVRKDAEGDSHHIVGVVVESDTSSALCFGQEFELDYWQHAHEIRRTRAGELTDFTSPSLLTLATMIHALHDGYVAKAEAEGIKPHEQATTKLTHDFHRIHGVLEAINKNT